MTTASKTILISTTEAQARAAIDRVLQAAVPEHDYTKGAHRFFQPGDPYGDRYRAVSSVIAALAVQPADPAGEITPCPHCAGPGKLISTMGDWVGQGNGENGGAYGPERRRVVCAAVWTEGAPPCPDTIISEDDATAIAVWNTRPPKAESGAVESREVADLRRALTDVVDQVRRKRCGYTQGGEGWLMDDEIWERAQRLAGTPAA